MGKTGRLILVSGALMGISQFALSDTLYSISSDDLSANTLFEQVIQEKSVVTVKPKLSATATGDVQVLNQCLWSVIVEPSAETVNYTPGKMVCVGPQQEVLETTPQGTIQPFADCSDNCNQFVIPGNFKIEMTLTQPLEFTLQPRNERK